MAAAAAVQPVKGVPKSKTADLKGAFLECRRFLDNRYVISLKRNMEDGGKDGEKEKEKEKVKGGLAYAIVIMDRSGSMGGHVHRVLAQLIPKIFRQLGYSDDYSIPVVMFDSSTVVQTMKLKEWEMSNYGCQGSTTMSGVFPELKTLIAAIPDDSDVQLIAISDGAIDHYDKEPSIAAANQLQQYLVTRRLHIHSLGIRYASSDSAAPDTRALASVLQFSNFKTTSSLVEIAYGTPDKEVIATIVSGMDHEEFKNDRYELSVLLTLEPQVVKDANAKDAKVDSVSPQDVAIPVLDKKEAVSPQEVAITASDKKEAVSGGALDKKQEHLKDVKPNFGFSTTPLHTQLSATAQIFADRVTWFYCGNAPLSSLSFTLKTADGTRFPLPLKESPALTIHNYLEVLEEPIRYYLQRLRVLKVVNSAEATEEMNQIVTFFELLERSFRGNTQLFKDRINSLRQSTNKKIRSVAMEMREIANNSLISRLDAAQQADYLRQADVGMLGRQMAKRVFTFMAGVNAAANPSPPGGVNSAGSAPTNSAAGASGGANNAAVVNADVKKSEISETKNAGVALSFYDVIRDEIKTMAAHIEELKDLNADDYPVSFYSQISTLESLRVLAGLVKTGELDLMENSDLLKLVTIVGTAASQAPGDYPDPMTYRIRHLWPNVHVSVADLLTIKSSQMHLPEADQKLLLVPGQDGAIRNVVPQYGDFRIAKFLHSFLPNTVEFVASVGMRGLIAPVPRTHAYTLVAGAWTSLEMLHKSPSEINIKTFREMMLGYEHAIGDHFEYVSSFLQRINPKQSKSSLYIGNNGITNMMGPLLKMERTKLIGSVQEVRAKDVKDANDVKGPLYSDDLLPAIFRALVSFEMYQTVRKRIRKSDNPAQFPIQVLRELMGQPDMKVNATVPTPLFEADVDVKTLTWNTDYVVDLKAVSTWASYSAHVNYVILLPILLKHIAKGRHSLQLTPEELKDFCNKVKAEMPEKLTDDVLQKYYGLTYDVPTFRFFTLVQCLLYQTVDDRVSHPSKEMKIIDLHDYKLADQMVRTTVAQWREAYYLDKLKEKKAEELKTLRQQWFTAISDEKDMKTTIELWKAGVQKGGVSFKPITEHANDICNMLWSPNAMVPNRFQKMWIALFGRMYHADVDKREIVWNNGNRFRYKMDIKDMKERCADASDAMIDSFQELYGKIVKYRYPRNKPNRHTHCNDKASYWAIGGYNSVHAYFADVLPVVEADYRDLHRGCCGLPV